MLHAMTRVLRSSLDCHLMNIGPIYVGRGLCCVQRGRDWIRTGSTKPFCVVRLQWFFATHSRLSTRIIPSALSIRGKRSTLSRRHDLFNFVRRHI